MNFSSVGYTVFYEDGVYKVETFDYNDELFGNRMRRVTVYESLSYPEACDVELTTTLSPVRNDFTIEDAKLAFENAIYRNQK